MYEPTMHTHSLAPLVVVCAIMSFFSSLQQQFLLDQLNAAAQEDTLMTEAAALLLTDNVDAGLEAGLDPMRGRPWWRWPRFCKIQPLAVCGPRE